MRISDWSSDVCSSDLGDRAQLPEQWRGHADRQVADPRHPQARTLIMTTAFDSTLASLGIGRTNAGSSPAVQTRQQQQTLDQSDFLELMTAQLKNQDPFSPVDNTQMVAQMAQFSSVPGIAEMNSKIGRTHVRTPI